MKHCLYASIGLIVCVLVFQSLGCSENNESDLIKEIDAPVGETIEVGPVAATPTPEIMFHRLRDEFAGRLENHGDFTVLREITTSRTYLDYLTKVYPTEVPVASLEGYAAVAPPDAERYTPFLGEWIDNPTAEDIAVMHRITFAHRGANYLLFHMLHRPNREALAKNLIRATEKALGSMKEPEAEAFLERHNLREQGFYKSFLGFVVKTEIADAIWLHERMETHGRDRGLLWSAVYKPALVGEILHNFSEMEVFLEWIRITRVRKMESE